jgi:hypothetical protein
MEDAVVFVKMTPGAAMQKLMKVMGGQTPSALTCPAKRLTPSAAKVPRLMIGNDYAKYSVIRFEIDNGASVITIDDEAFDAVFTGGNWREELGASLAGTMEDPVCVTVEVTNAKDVLKKMRDTETSCLSPATTGKNVIIIMNVHACARAYICMRKSIYMHTYICIYKHTPTNAYSCNAHIQACSPPLVETSTMPHLHGEQDSTHPAVWQRCLEARLPFSTSRSSCGRMHLDTWRTRRNW